jgi:lipopolysaccharide/colanic/teichoic acid biosynthesis glycosyltransferase
VSVTSLEAVEVSGAALTSLADLARDRRVRYHHPFYRAVKRTFDLGVSLTALVILSPLFLIVGGMLAVQDGFPVIFRQTRVGMNGRRFRIYKFRTMIKNAEELLLSRPELMEEYQRYYKLQNDPRISRIGRFLRRTTLDELPQLLNVIRGDMSLVGPRPIVEPELEKYGDCKYLYLAMKPGCAGLWQCSGRSDTSYAERVKLDEEYFRRSSLRYDVGILWRTVVAIFLRRGAH